MRMMYNIDSFNIQNGTSLCFLHILERVIKMQLNMSGESIESLLYCETKPVLELKISYPQIMGPLSKKSEFRFNDLYCRQARTLNRKARTELYRQATEAYRNAQAQEYDFNLYSYIRTFCAPRLDRIYTSVIFDLYVYYGGAHGMTVRTGQTWDFRTGARIPLSYFFQQNTPYRKIILNSITEQVREQVKKEEILFFDNPEQNIRQYFREQNFYLTGNSFVFFYPLYTLAPYYAGILCYKVPFEELKNCFASERHPALLSNNPMCFSERFGNELL